MLQRTAARCKATPAFVDHVKVLLSSGCGGDGASVMLHEHSNEFAGPGGGNGGNGGNVMLRCSRRHVDLQHIAAMGAQLTAAAGCTGYTRKAFGRRGSDLWLEVPPGTEVTDVDTNEVVYDLDEDGMEVLLLEGGQGGKGNAVFANKWHHSPVESTRGLPGNTMLAQIELKTIADCGLIGYPNAGKSSLLAAMSTSKPRIAPYAFTTLRPYVGVIHDLYGNRCRIADTPGLIEGAYENRGLGHQFLRHVERTHALAIVVDMCDTYNPYRTSSGDGGDAGGGVSRHDTVQPWDVVRLLQCELDYYMQGLSERVVMVLANKMDIPADSSGTPTRVKLAELRRRVQLPVFAVSAARALTLGAQHPDTGLPDALAHLCGRVFADKKTATAARSLQRARAHRERQVAFLSKHRGVFAAAAALSATATLRGADDTSASATLTRSDVVAAAAVDAANTDAATRSLVDQQLSAVGCSGLGTLPDTYRHAPASGKLHQYRDLTMKGRYWTLTRRRNERVPDEKWH